MQAAAEGHLEAMKHLLAAKADPNIKNAVLPLSSPHPHLLSADSGCGLAA